MHLLIDECLSPRLVDLANELGFRATHVARIGLRGLPDWRIMAYAIQNDMVLVTKNSVDFRGPEDRSGTAGHYAKADIHAGLICLNGPVGMDLRMQMELFGYALDNLLAPDQMINMALEVSLYDRDSDSVQIRIYPIPQHCDLVSEFATHFPHLRTQLAYVTVGKCSDRSS